jgi:DNA polymerase-3 subunit epsilon
MSESTTAAWWRGSALAFDIESTGVNVIADRVVTAALVHLGDGPPRPERFMVDPGVEIPAEATAIHGITTEVAKATGVQPAGALRAIADTLVAALSAGVPVLGTNLVYDLSLLHFECLRHGLPTLTERLGGEVAPIVDALVVDRAVDTYRKGKRKLPNLCANYEVKHHGEHDSAYDALAAAEVIAAIMEKFPALQEMSLPELHRAQVGWAREQQVGLQRYFDETRRSGEEREVVEMGWPLYDITAAGAS